MADRNTDITIAIPALMEATMFAADKHRGQKRKDARGTPYINHPITVVNLMAKVGGITDIEALQAGMLHDTVEDTDATAVFRSPGLNDAIEFPILQAANRGHRLGATHRTSRYSCQRVCPSASSTNILPLLRAG